MLEKLRQATIITLLLNLLMALSSPSATHTAPVSKWRENIVPILSQPAPISPGRDS
jgi:type IV secretory pathway VirB2 component (pilin)